MHAGSTPALNMYYAKRWVHGSRMAVPNGRGALTIRICSSLGHISARVAVCRAVDTGHCDSTC